MKCSVKRGQVASTSNMALTLHTLIFGPIPGTAYSPLCTARNYPLAQS